jgi:hypothetical protein
MANGISLPALNINAVAPAFSSSTLGLAPPMPNPAAVVASQHLVVYNCMPKCIGER